VLENYLEDSNFEFEAQAVSFLKQHGELAALTMALLAKEVQVEERCFNLDGNLTLRGAEQAITRAVHQTVDTAKTVQSVVGKYVAPDSSEHLAGAIQSIKQMLGSSVMQSVQIQLEQVGVSPMVFQTLRTVGAAIPSDHSEYARSSHSCCRGSGDRTFEPNRNAGCMCVEGRCDTFKPRCGSARSIELGDRSC
jgi:hypothetical protein